ncbi:HAMP domain-containing sensor histidine kinase [Corynebacterium felinum]|uniref:histidine kinase n=1 Tax=Corynebacterium felinum TaxID=131318 RepID=A0ABU2B5V4_9CORY|nr:HAMP domain-containing sensor histidine kinase [Corynebacterium felinum]MDF5821233.1 HAMP domain-containing sensor histidine kinase [Corynebacterium felinum]MDR7353766.1 two-component system OmpR family sensor kinase [Corynebacterium felinum]WJY95945.1 putative sensor histidine kinase TcrY [Corynebacterium felinum]
MLNPFSGSSFADASTDSPAQSGKKRVTRAGRDTRRGVPLRFGLVFVTILITSFGLLASGVAIQQSMEAEALSRVDEELKQGLNTWAKQDSLYAQANSGFFSLPSDFFVGRYYHDGKLVYVSHEPEEIPDTRNVNVDGQPHTVRSWQRDDSTEWRVIASTHRDFIVVVAKQIDEDREFLNRLAAGQISIGIIVLVMVGLFGHVIIQKTLQPLRKVEETAKAIAGGDLDRRAPVLPENTEVGAMSRSMNVMMEQLQSVIIELQAKEAQMRRFVGDASHELRTPLTSVKGYAELYRCGATDDAKMVLNKIEEEAGRMSVLVEDLLSLTRAEETRFEEMPVDVLSLSQSVLGSVQGAFPDRSMTVSGETDEPPVVIGDPGRLRQVLTNLVVNALKHGGDEAKVDVVVGATAESITVDVIDDGVGMTAEDASHIFERFYRADTSRTRATGGSGLGLAIVKSIVESHKGTITVTTAPGEGTTFRVSFPKVVMNSKKGNL